jgi:acyl-CoA thioesterase-2
MTGSPDGSDLVTLGWLLDLERLDRDLFRAPSPRYRRRRNLFGGQVAAQSLRAAAATVPAGHLPHSYHLYFMRPGRIAEPVLLYVSRVRDGRSFSTRNVVAQQDGEAILTMSASFHVLEAGPADYHLPAARVPGPDDPMLGATPEPITRQHEGYAPLEARHLPTPAADASSDGGVHRVRSWMRLHEALDDDPVVHACAFAYMSDTATGNAPLAASGYRDYSQLMMTSLDHALHFHRLIRADDWVLVEFEAVSVGTGRGFTRGTIHAADGRLGAHVEQELLMRSLDPGRSSYPPPPDRDLL